MKRINPIFSFLLLTLLLSSCGGDGERSDAYGNFEADEVLLSAETAGKIILFEIREGQAVKAGEVLAIIDTTDYVLKRQQLVKQIDAVKANLSSLQAQKAVFIQQKENLQKDLQRVKAMKEDGAATQKQLDDIEGGIALAERQAASVEAQRGTILHQVEGLQVQLRELENNLEKAVIHAPIDGTVLTTFVEQGELAVPGKALMKLADLRMMKLKVYVSGAQLSQIALGQDVQVLVDDGKENLRELKGSVNWISDEAEFTPKIIQTRDERVNMVYAVEVEVANDGKLKVGMPGEVNF